jgi:ubiquitin carboxyl-terminal hydrolase 48
VATLQLLANDVIDLREDEEVIEIDSDSDSKPISKRRREEGQGFGGTLLGTTDSSWSSSPEQTPVPAVGSGSEKACLACTFSNTFDAVACQICDTIFV